MFWLEKGSLFSGCCMIRMCLDGFWCLFGRFMLLSCLCYICMVVFVFFSMEGGVSIDLGQSER